MRRRAPTVSEQVVGALPADLAAGPLPEIWGDDPSMAKGAWRRAGCTWSRANDLRSWGWLALLPDRIRWTYEPSSLERAAQRAGHPIGYIDGRRARPS